jgi:hypothetical protein
MFLMNVFNVTVEKDDMSCYNQIQQRKSLHGFAMKGFFTVKPLMA